MTIISSRDQIVAPTTNLLSYLFDSPYSDHEIWPADDHLFLSPPESEYPSYTFEQVLHLTKCLSSGLQRLGAQGKRVVVYGDSNVHFQIALLGAIGAGAAVNPCPCSTVHDTVFRLQKIDADLVIFNSTDMETVRLAAAEANFREEQLFSIDHLIEGGKATGEVQHWSALFDFEKGPVFQWPQLSSKESKETVAFYLYTSGSTGGPKLAVRTHAAFIGNIEQDLYRRHLAGKDKEIVLSGFKGSGIGGILGALMTPLKARWKTIFVGPCDLEGYMQIVTTLRPTFMFLPKYMIHQILENAPDADLRSIKEVVTGGATVPFQLRDAWIKRHRSFCEVSYGLTELGIVIGTSPARKVMDESVGELLPNLDAKVVSPSGQTLGRNQVGELYIRTQFGLSGYLNDPGQCAMTADGWFRTGDLFRVNDSNEWYMVGRKKDLFNGSRGNHVSAVEIESALLLHPEILDASVVAVKLPDDEEPFPRAYLVKRLGSELKLEEFFFWMVKTLPLKMHLLGGAGFLKSLPITNTGNGKPDRKALEELAARDVILHPDSIPGRLGQQRFKSD